MEKLMNHNWTGNIRELENSLMQAVVMTNSDIILEENILLSNSINDRSDFSVNLSLAEVESKHIKNVLDSTKWNKPEAAKILGISLPTLYSKIDIYQLLKE